MFGYDQVFFSLKHWKQQQILRTDLLEFAHYIFLFWLLNINKRVNLVQFEMRGNKFYGKEKSLHYTLSHNSKARRHAKKHSQSFCVKFIPVSKIRRYPRQRKNFPILTHFTHFRLLAAVCVCVFVLWRLQNRFQFELIA